MVAPKLRFKEFSGDWEKQLWGRLLNFLMVEGFHLVKVTVKNVKVPIVIMVPLGLLTI